MSWDDPLQVQAWATVALFAAAVAAGIVAGWVLCIELSRDKQRRIEARAEQARKIAGWVQWVDDARDPAAGRRYG